MSYTCRCNASITFFFEDTHLDVVDVEMRCAEMQPWVFIGFAMVGFGLTDRSDLRLAHSRDIRVGDEYEI